MKITRIFAHRVELPLHETTYKWSGGKSVTVFDSTIVGVEMDTGVVGYTEVCSPGRIHIPSWKLSPATCGFTHAEIVSASRRSWRGRCV